jgi:hypothetical protein
MTDQQGEKTKENAPAKAQRQRSPNYPSIDLQVAVSKATAFEKAVGKNKAAYEAAASYMGFTPTSSSALRCVAALVSFGLLDEEGQGKARKLWLSDIGRAAVMATEASPERQAALREAALRPRLHRELWDRWGGRLPDDETIRSYLRLELGFVESATSPFITEFKTTIDFAKLSESGTVSPDGQDPSAKTDPLIASMDTFLGRPFVPEGSKMDTNSPAAKESMLSIALPSGGTAMLRVPGSLTAADVRKIKKHLDAMEEEKEKVPETD